MANKWAARGWQINTGLLGLETIIWWMIFPFKVLTFHPCICMLDCRSRFSFHCKDPKLLTYFMSIANKLFPLSRMALDSLIVQSSPLKVLNGEHRCAFKHLLIYHIWACFFRVQTPSPSAFSESTSQGRPSDMVGKEPQCTIYCTHYWMYFDGWNRRTHHCINARRNSWALTVRWHSGSISKDKWQMMRVSMNGGTRYPQMDGLKWKMRSINGWFGGTHFSGNFNICINITIVQSSLHSVRCIHV